VSRLVTEHPAYKRWKRELDQAKAALDQFRKREAEVWQPYERAVADWERKARAAAAAGKPSPERPKEPASPYPEGTLFHLTDERQRIVSEEQRVLAAIASDVERAAFTRERELRDIIAPEVGAIVAAAAELRGLLMDVRRCRDARAPQGVRPIPSERMLRSVLPGMLVNIAPSVSVFDQEPLEPRPPAPPDPPIITTTPPPRVGGRTGAEI
jgi:hypothetical protein